MSEVLDAYLSDATTDLAERTLETRRRYLENFRLAFGSRRVMEVTPFELKQWVMQNVNRYRTGNTRANVNVAVQRVFNWAVKLRVIKENPFKGLTWTEEKATGRDMKPEEFQAIMQATDPYFRRFLIALRMTGARPGELASLRWEHLDWQRAIALLPFHKSRKKTGKSRVLVFPPQCMKLLAIIKRDQYGAAAVELRKILETAADRTVKVRDVVARMKARGYSYRALYRARQAIGAKYKRIGGWAEHGCTVYWLPVNPELGELARPWGRNAPDTDHVFQCSKCRPWTRTALGEKFARLRDKLGLPASCKLYGLRHCFITEAVRRNVNLKAIATLVGHQDTRMIDKVYCHVGEDYEFLHAAALQALGQEAQPMELVSEPDDVTEQLIKLEEANKEPVARKPRAKRTGLQASQEIAWKAYHWALEQNPGMKTDKTVFAWLRERPEFAGQLPEALDTFRRYLHYARRFHHGCGKRAIRRLEFAIPS